MITVRNPAMAGATMRLAGGVEVVYDAQGVAAAPKACGIHQIPGNTVIDGEPVDPTHAAGGSTYVAGRIRLCQGPAYMAGAQVCCGPAGEVVLEFDAKAQAPAPENCGIDQVPGYLFLPDPEPALAPEPPAAETDPPPPPAKGKASKAGAKE